MSDFQMERLRDHSHRTAVRKAAVQRGGGHTAKGSLLVDSVLIPVHGARCGRTYGNQGPPPLELKLGAEAGLGHSLSPTKGDRGSSTSLTLEGRAPQAILLSWSCLLGSHSLLMPGSELGGLPEQLCRLPVSALVPALCPSPAITSNPGPVSALPSFPVPALLLLQTRALPRLGFLHYASLLSISYQFRSQPLP